MTAITAWILIVQEAVFRSRIPLYVEWLEYETGKTGFGTTALDVKPSRPRPWLPRLLRKELDACAVNYAGVKRNAFRQAMLDVTGEAYP